MDVMLQEHDAKLILPVPEGLRELSCDICREVLRAQPAHIYQFIADYTAALLETRDKAREAAIIVHDILEQGLTYEAMLQRRGISMELANRAATIIQAAFRGYLGRMYVRRLQPQEEEFNIEKFVASLGIPFEEVEAAVIKIQSLFRGRQARKNIKRHGPEVTPSIMDFLVETGVTLEEANRAAVCIQRIFRRHTIMRKKEASQTGGLPEVELVTQEPAAVAGEDTAENVSKTDEVKEEQVVVEGVEEKGQEPKEEPPVGETPGGETPAQEPPGPAGDQVVEPPPTAENADEGAVVESEAPSEVPESTAPPSEVTDTTTERDQQMLDVTTDDEATTSPETSVISPGPTTDGEEDTSPGMTETTANTTAEDTEASEIEEEEE